MPKIITSPAAERDLEEIWDYIAEHDETAADKFLDELVKKFYLLAENRTIGKRQDDFIVEMRRFSHKNYYIYYFATEDGVEIYRVLHGKRNVEELFENHFEGLSK